MTGICLLPTTEEKNKESQGILRRGRRGRRVIAKIVLDDFKNLPIIYYRETKNYVIVTFGDNEKETLVVVNRIDMYSSPEYYFLF